MSSFKLLTKLQLTSVLASCFFGVVSGASPGTLAPSGDPGGIQRESARLRDARLAPRAPLEEVPELGLEGVLSSAAVSHPKSPLMETVAPSEILSSLRLRVFVLPACAH